MQDWAYFFILIVPVDASQAEPDAFRRVGILVVETEDEETVSGLLSRSRGGAKSIWDEYSKVIKLL